MTALVVAPTLRLEAPPDLQPAPRQPGPHVGRDGDLLRPPAAGRPAAVRGDLLLEPLPGGLRRGARRPVRRAADGEVVAPVPLPARDPVDAARAVRAAPRGAPAGRGPAAGRRWSRGRWRAVAAGLPGGRGAAVACGRRAAHAGRAAGATGATGARSPGPGRVRRIRSTAGGPAARRGRRRHSSVGTRPVSAAHAPIAS